MKKEIIYFVIALIIFCFVAVDIYWWIVVSSDASKSFQQMKSEYLERFPTILQNARIITLLNIGLLATASFLFMKAQTLQKIKLVSKIFFVTSMVLIAWQVFTLM